MYIGVSLGKYGTPGILLGFQTETVRKQKGSLQRENSMHNFLLKRATKGTSVVMTK